MVLALWPDGVAFDVEEAHPGSEIARVGPARTSAANHCFRPPIRMTFMLRK